MKRTDGFSERQRAWAAHRRWPTEAPYRRDTFNRALNLWTDRQERLGRYTEASFQRWALVAILAIEAGCGDYDMLSWAPLTRIRRRWLRGG